MNVDIDSVLEFFDFYTQELNWQIIPVRNNSKKPVWQRWNNAYNMEQARDFIQSQPCNLGLLLGEIVDIEADTEVANRKLQDLTNGVKHPMYRSEKSIHHLFLSPDRNLTRVVIAGIEFRGSKHQSLIPPSTNVKGVSYTWLSTPTAPGVMPEKLAELYRTGCVKQPNRDIVHPRCNGCLREMPIHHVRYKLEVRAFLSLEQRWQCRNCRKQDVRPLCRQIKRMR